MSDMQIQHVLTQLRALADRANAGPVDAASQAPDFANLLKRSLDQVNAAQQDASELATRFTAGASDVGLPEVMVAMQKASLEFEAVAQVRNRLLAAYQEIMNMPV